jgi:hypothetical protein
VDGSLIDNRRLRRARLRRFALPATFGLVLVSASTVRAGQLQIDGLLTGATLDNRGDPSIGGVLTVGDRRVVVPAQLSIELPGTTLTLAELFARAPARCRGEGLTGLLPTDTCRRPPMDPDVRVWSPADDTTPRTTLDPVPTDEPPTIRARVTAASPAGESGTGRREAIATRIVLVQDGGSVNGAVTFVNEGQGYLRVGGAFGVDAGGAVVRINDPDARQSVQSGLGCGAEGNCSPDVRFRADSGRYTVRFEGGYPACIPGGLGDVCAASNRPIPSVADAARLIPIRAGDHVTALGAFEVVDGVRILSAHTVVDHTSPHAPQPEP